MAVVLSVAAPAIGQNLESFHLKVTAWQSLLRMSETAVGVDPGAGVLECVGTRTSSSSPRKPSEATPSSRAVVRAGTRRCSSHLPRRGLVFSFLHERFGVLEDQIAEMDAVRLPRRIGGGNRVDEITVRRQPRPPWDLSDQDVPRVRERRADQRRHGPVGRPIWSMIPSRRTTTHIGRGARGGGTDTINGTLDGTDVDELLIPR